jgi:Phage tail tube protein
MAPTFKAARSAFFSVTSATGGVINLSSGLDDSNLNRTVGTADVTAYSDIDKAFIPTLREGTISVSGHANSTHSEKLDAMLGHSTGTSFVWGPAGSSSTANTNRKYTGKAIVTGLNYTAPIADKVSVSMDLQVTGAITSTFY